MTRINCVSEHSQNQEHTINTKTGYVLFYNFERYGVHYVKLGPRFKYESLLVMGNPPSPLVVLEVAFSSKWKLLGLF